MREKWGGQWGFLLSAAGSAIGLGNIYKFPYITGVNGGGAFVLFYLLCILLIAFPVMVAELMIGQKSQSNAWQAFDRIEGRKSNWKIGGFLALISTLLIMSFYAVIGGWILYYLQVSIFDFQAFASASSMQEVFSKVLTNPALGLSYQFLFMILCFYMVLGGIQKGIERMNKILIPVLVLILIVLLLYASGLAGFKQAWLFLFDFKFDHFTVASMREAVGHSFFTVSVGIGIMVTYGSYLPARTKVLRTAAVIVIVDTIIALASGLIIFSVAFTSGVEVGEGPTLLFKTLPGLFYTMPSGQFLAVLFFVLVACTAFTSMISLIEVPTSFLVDSGRSRRKSLTIVLVAITFLGVLSGLSYSVLSGVNLPWGPTFFDLFDHLTGNLFLPITGMLCVLFFAYKMNKVYMQKSFIADNLFRHLFQLCVKVVSPLGILAVLLLGLFAD